MSLRRPHQYVGAEILLVQVNLCHENLHDFIVRICRLSDGSDDCAQARIIVQGTQSHGYLGELLNYPRSCFRLGLIMAKNQGRRPA